MRAPGMSVIRRWKYTENESKLARRIRGMRGAGWQNPEVDPRRCARVGKSVGCEGGTRWTPGGGGVNAKVQDNYPHGWQCVFHFDQVCVFLRSPIKPLLEPVPHLFHGLAPNSSPSLPSFFLPLYHRGAWWVGNPLLSFTQNVLIILNSDPRASNLWPSEKTCLCVLLGTSHLVRCA